MSKLRVHDGVPQFQRRDLELAYAEPLGNP
jgi:hypothetical protein